MGLDTVELVMRFEEAFGISIPNADAEKIETPRHVIDYVAGKENNGLTREEIARIIREITLDQLGIDPAEYAEDKTFVKDCGAD